MADWYLLCSFDLPGGSVAATLEADGSASVRTTAPLRGRDHVGTYRARFAPTEHAKLRERLVSTQYANAAQGAPVGPDVPHVTFGEGQRGKLPQVLRSFPRAQLEPRLAGAFEELVAHVEAALAHPRAALRASGQLEARKLAPRDELRFRVRLESIGSESASWPNPLVALAQRKARLALQVAELGTERVQQVELDPALLALVGPDGAPFKSEPLCKSAPGTFFELLGSAPALLEPGQWSAVVLVALAEPRPSDANTVYGTWTIDLGTFEVKP